MKSTGLGRLRVSEDALRSRDKYEYLHTMSRRRCDRRRHACIRTLGRKGRDEMAKHLSLRLPWHDRGWDGHVCDNPVANVYCSGEYGLKAHGIRDKKDDAQEKAIGSQPVEGIRPACYRPPCLQTIQTFGGRRALSYLHEPKEFLNRGNVTITPVAEEIPPCCSGTWPYDQVFRRAEDAPEGTPDEFEERFSPAEADGNLDRTFAEFRSGKSLAFYYLNYDNPLNSERRKYVLVGAADIDGISKQLRWEQIDPDVDRVYGRLVWNRFVSNGYAAGRGARVPYDLYLKQGVDPADMLIEIPDEMAQHFKYVCRVFTDDEAAMFLRDLLGALERGREAKAVTWDWDRQIAWINTALDRVLKDRGAFPGMGAVLEALGFANAILYVDRHITAKGIKDARQHVLERIKTPPLAEDAKACQGYATAAKTLRVLPPAVKTLLLDRLCLFELSPEQVRLIAGNGLVDEKSRLACGLTSTADAIAGNPFLIVEEYDPVDRDERIPFHRIDNGLYLPQATGGIGVPDLAAFAPDDKRRLRAASLVALRAAMADGHSFLPQDDLLRAIVRRRLPGLPDALGPVVLARDLDFYEERMSLVEGKDFTGWMPKVLADDEDVIRRRIGKLHARKPRSSNVTDWAAHLPHTAKLPPAALKEVLKTQGAALGRLGTHAFSVLTGGAGTGKTTVIAALIKGLRAEDPTEKFLLLAPTGKAAVRLRRKIKDVAEVDLEPRTIHSYLLRHGWMDGDTFRPLRDAQPVQSDVSTVVVDECSMLETQMLATVIRSIDWTSPRLKRLILAGDAQQLPPIGTGAPFKNIVDHLCAASEPAQRPCELTVNCRQIQENSTALRLAEQFTGKADRVTADDLLEEMAKGGRVGIDLEVRFFKDETDLPGCVTGLVADALNELLTLNRQATRFDPAAPWVAYDGLHRLGGENDVADWRMDAFEILSPYRGGYYGSDTLNTLLQKLLRGPLLPGKYPPKLGKPGGRRFLASDKVLQVRNMRIKAKSRIAWDGHSNVDFYLANGELGRMMKVGWKDKDKVGWGRFETDPSVVISMDQRWAEGSLDLGYAMSVHKAQGSDFGGVIVVVPKEERVRLVTRELLYTALTRFTGRMYLLVQGAPGDLDALRIGLWRGASCFLRRHTCLYSATRAIAELDDYRPEKRIIRTLRDELVASKSEALIATILAAKKVPYFYERLLIGKDGSPRRPDFTIPVETADGPSVLYWEHWGKLGDPAYDASVKKRRAWYRRNKLEGQLIETDEIGGFDAKKIAAIIDERILP